MTQENQIDWKLTLIPRPNLLQIICMRLSYWEIDARCVNLTVLSPQFGKQKERTSGFFVNFFSSPEPISLT
jgi:hypothetical protein